MTVPITNNTCDIYRSGTAPPAAPAVAGANIWLAADYERRMESGESVSNNFRYTHTCLINPTVDIRDSHQIVNPGGTWGFGGQDSIYIPDQNGTRFTVRFIERKARNTPFDHKKVYLDRAGATWPTNNV